ncbi:MAG: DUF1501 domain-containing protein [Betaproteobacteria bacterium]|nr:DUF1501 domain-containing protein [Betaproteobacteria bacterium]
MNRRDLLRRFGAWPLMSAGLGAAGALVLPRSAMAADYRALVCVFLSGGNDGNNLLVPTDGAYADYSAARFDLALPRDSLVALSGTSAGHAFGVHPAASGLATLYNQKRLAFIANVGPLVQPVTAAQVLNHTAVVPPFLLSHSDQVAMQQGWSGDEDASGWAGRSLELLPADLRHSVNALSADNDRTLVLGRASGVASFRPGGARYWGTADLAQPSTAATQSLNRMAQWQFSNDYESEYARTFGAAVEESTIITQAFLRSTTPQGDFGSDDLSRNLRSIAQVLPAFKAMGYRRQVFLLHWGQFDTHTGQRGTGERTQDAQIATLSQAITAFDAAIRAAGMDTDVTTLMMSDFGRTLKPASGGGSDHAWGNHWFVAGGAVAGGQVVGQLPSLKLGGTDDFDRAGEGRFVPTLSSDQVGATIMQWMGLPSASLLGAFPHLANFSRRNLGFMQA